ncbi:hypothetical protein Trydic_g9420 [Trypoxylus dichotomus]
MDELIEQYQNLRLSAFDKLKQVNSSIHNITLGPNSNYKEDIEEISIQNVKLQQKKLEPKSTVYYTRPQLPDLRVLLKMKELERLEKVQEAIADRQKFFTEQQKIHNHQMRSRWEQKQKELLLQIERQEMQIFQAEEEQNKNFLIQNEQRQRYYQELEERRKKRDLELQAKEQMRRNLDYMNKIMKNQQEISVLYQDILNLLKTTVIDESIKKSIGEVSQKLKVLSLDMDEIAKKSKMSVSPAEVQKSTDLVGQMVVLKDEVQKIINEHKQNEMKLKEEQIRRMKEATPSTSTAPSTSKPLEPAQVEISSPAKLDKFISKASFSWYSELQEFLKNYEKSYANLLANESLKQFKFDCKKAVNIPVNAISAVNTQHLLDKYMKLSNLLAGNPVPVGDSQMSAKTHPEGTAFCTDLLAKKFILQGDLMISSNPEAAFCYATIIISLWNEFPQFGKLLLAHLHKQCPFLVPIHMPKSMGQTNEDYYKSLGYQYTDGVVEKHDKYLKRMTGIMRLYSAILISKPKKSQNGHNPHGLSQGWRWLTATLNLEPKSDVTATLIYVFLEIVGAMMQSTYKKEFQKIIKFIIDIYMPMLKKVDSGGPYTRLEVLLQEYQEKGHFPPPIGRLPPNYW